MSNKVSVVMSVYNAEKTIEEAIDSLLCQTYEHYDIIICDDCSSDGTGAICKTYAEAYPEKITLIRNEKNLQVAASLNRCLGLADGEYIARMDSDDISVADRLERQAAYLDAHPDTELVGTAMQCFDEKGEFGVRVLAPDPTAASMKLGSPFAHATVMCRRRVFEELGGYRTIEKTVRCEDLDLWFRFFEKGFTGHNLSEPLYCVREGRDAFRRRKLRDGLNGTRVSLEGFSKLGFPFYLRVFALKPLVSCLIPAPLMKLYHKRRDNDSMRREIKREKERG